jgi:hypothetical protein
MGVVELMEPRRWVHSVYDLPTWSGAPMNWREIGYGNE